MASAIWFEEPNRPIGGRAQQNVATRKLDDLRNSEQPKSNDPVKPWKTFGEMRDAFIQVREAVGETRYDEELKLAGAIIKETGEPSASALKSTHQAVELYNRLVKIAKQQQEVA